MENHNHPPMFTLINCLGVTFSVSTVCFFCHQAQMTFYHDCSNRSEIRLGEKYLPAFPPGNA